MIMVKWDYVILKKDQINLCGKMFWEGIKINDVNFKRFQLKN